MEKGSLVVESVEDSAKPGPLVTWKTSLIGSDIGATLQLLIDLLYLARRYPERLNEPIMLAIRAYLDRRHRDRARWVANHPACRERLLHAALKLAFSTTHDVTLPQWLIDWVHALASATDDQLLARALFAATVATPRDGLRVIVRPELRNGAWIALVHEVESEEAQTSAGGQGAAMRTCNIQVEHPEMPGCCRYQDFRRGIAEIAWYDSGVHAFHATQFASVDVSPGGATSDAHRVDAPAWVVQRNGVGSIRLDYNFLCTIAGQRRGVEVEVAPAREG